LNAGHPEIDYGIEPAQDIIDKVNAAVASGDPAEIEDLKNELDALNNAGNGIDQHGRPAN
jgi:hypothetical protein